MSPLTDLLKGMYHGVEDTIFNIRHSTGTTKATLGLAGLFALAPVVSSQAKPNEVPRAVATSSSDPGRVNAKDYCLENLSGSDLADICEDLPEENTGRQYGTDPTCSSEFSDFEEGKFAICTTPKERKRLESKGWKAEEKLPGEDYAKGNPAAQCPDGEDSVCTVYDTSGSNIDNTTYQGPGPGANVNGDEEKKCEPEIRTETKEIEVLVCDEDGTRAKNGVCAKKPVEKSNLVSIYLNSGAMHNGLSDIDGFEGFVTAGLDLQLYKNFFAGIRYRMNIHPDNGSSSTEDLGTASEFDGETTHYHDIERIVSTRKNGVSHQFGPSVGYKFSDWLQLRVGADFKNKGSHSKTDYETEAWQKGFANAGIDGTPPSFPTSGDSEPKDSWSAIPYLAAEADIDLHKQKLFLEIMVETGLQTPIIKGQGKTKPLLGAGAGLRYQF